MMPMRQVRSWRAVLILMFLPIAGGAFARAQNNYQMSNYEIQVYGSQTVAPGATLLESFGNVSADGTVALAINGYSRDQLYPSDDALHESIEVTQGIRDWAEVGFYVFNNARSGGGWQWVGDHVRPRVRVPDRWHWPVGASLSMEFGYQRPHYSTDTWTMELRPILDKQLGRWYVAANPALERSFRGQSVSQGVAFDPSMKVSYRFNRNVSGGVEYYGGYGSLRSIATFHNQQQQFFSVMDIHASPDWDVNLGLGIGVTATTDDWIWKANIGRRFNWTRSRAGNS